jgi:hypothetical protein
MPTHISHDPTVTEAIAAVEAVLDAHQRMHHGGATERASFNGAALQLVELIAEAVEQRLKRRAQIEDASAKLKLAAESAKIA